MTRNQWDVAVDFQPATDQRVPAQPASLLPATPKSARRRRTAAGWFWGSLGILVLAIVAYDAWAFLGRVFDQNRDIGFAFSALMAVVVLSALAWIAKEIAVMIRLRSVESARGAVVSRLGHAGPEEMSALIDVIARTLARRPTVRPAIAAYRRQIGDTHRAEQQVELFARTVLEPIDAEAYRAIGRAGASVGVLTSIAPTALLDTAIMVWRSVGLMREIAELYGYRTGVAGTVHLLRSLASGAAILAATDVATQIVAQQMGGAVAERVAGKLGGGLVAASRTVRLGLLTMQLCRVIPFGEKDLPTLRRLVQTLLDRDAAGLAVE